MEYLTRGYPVFPLGLDKTPLVSSWKEYQERLPTEQEVEAWWQQWPDAGIAIVTGKISGISVVDVDTYKGGDPSPFPETKTVETTTGGLHLYYEYSPDAWTHENEETHVDVRSDAGYVVAPPSEANKKDGSGIGTYKLIKDIPLVPFPSHLFPKRGQKRDWKAIESGTPEGSRNSNMAAFFGRLMEKLPSDEWESLVWPTGQLVNSRNQPPLSDEELRTTFASIATREKEKGSSKDDREISYEGETLEELYKVKFPDLEWLAEGLIPLGGLSAVTGAPKSFKTFLVQDLAISVVTGKPFLGKFPVATGKVLFIDEENPRRTTVKRFKGMGASSTKEIVLLARKGVRMDKPKSVAALLRFVEKMQPRLIVIDSLTKVHSKNENQSNEMSDVFTEIKKLLADDRAVVVIHHHNKASRNDRRGEGASIRGSGNIYAELDAHLAVDRTGADRRDIIVTQGALRDAEELKPFSASLAMDENGSVRFTYKGELNEKQAAFVSAVNAVRELFTSAEIRLTVDECVKETELAIKIVREALKKLEDDKVLTHKQGHRNLFTYQLVVENDIQSGAAAPPKNEPV